ncbi:MAG: hypothetical protein MI754_18890 [Chromatiales bacterium]|nr:hypothetical protein [Chromatiales bacterium]
MVRQKPKQGIKLAGYDVIIIPFVIWWFRDIPGMLLHAYEQGASLSDKIIALTLFSIGLYLLVVRFFFEAYACRITTYYLPKESIIFEWRGLTKKTVTIPLQEIEQISLSNYHKERASIILNDSKQMWSLEENFPSFMFLEDNEYIGFDSVENAKAVKELIQETQKNFLNNQ